MQGANVGAAVALHGPRAAAGGRLVLAWLQVDAEFSANRGTALTPPREKAAPSICAHARAATRDAVAPTQCGGP